MKLYPLLVAPLVGARVVQLPQQQQQVLVQEEGGAVGVGVQFTTSHAVAAARYEDGTVRDLVRIEADSEYFELLSQWTRSQDKSKCHGILGRLGCSLRRAGCQTRKAFGLPASRNSGILSNFLSRVRGAIEEELGSPISSIAPVFPLLPSFEEEDFQDALESVGLTSTRSEHGSNELVYQETNAAYAGLGYGLCTSWSSHQACMDEASQMPYGHILFLNFDDSFSATVQYMDNISQEWSYSHSINTSLGWWDLPVFEIPRAKFWARIHEEIVEVAGALQQPPNKIILQGAHARDEEFVEVVKAALWDVLEFDVSMLLEADNKVDPGTVAARGAAELAWRAEHLSLHHNGLEETEGMEL
ncbi:hypothetical protein P153DRAFT_383509 [Dothidotthia symphoricarpi CBS 119687]|uniref:Uncharacterized protein n=1 Tax=Dothidotthia symphoricarpi CBS 119687 TaxID=1392245 RepID=A0A6A6AJW1_9PLEO|nr:uncharacterized protein P153DRAFT_383509 [Dothidotthia symphoricarpi CBS 119687]KAF2131398.1 hypothetical protein P153DRAFT_383509 [Dothidotthia symphoricarpi CBS 119687]